MNILSPSILAADFNRLGEQIEATRRGGATYLHLDVMDGLFVPSISFGMPVIRSLRGGTDQIFDVHLMVTEPERYIADFAACGADIITFHLEATGEPGAVIERIRAQGKRVGLSIKPGTPVESVLPYLPRIDMLLVMTVEPGFGGQKYLPESTARIRKARALITERDLPVDIEVDGGLSADNVGVVLEAGANVIVAGSSVFGGDVLGNTRRMVEKLRAY